MHKVLIILVAVFAVCLVDLFAILAVCVQNLIIKQLREERKNKDV